jgi:hypothetical protein
MVGIVVAGGGGGRYAPTPTDFSHTL